MSPASPSSRPPSSFHYFSAGYLGVFSLARDHYMRGWRAVMTDRLLEDAGIKKKLPAAQWSPPSSLASFEDLTRFHTPEYVKALEEEKENTYFNLLCSKGVDNDTPVFDGQMEYCQYIAGASLEAARLLNSGKVKTAVNWGGGMHHAKADWAAGFCYVNDCVLAILELLKVHPRVLYIDIDVHHGDGVEEAFYTTDRVMTVSVHKYGHSFYPNTGHLEDVGEGQGRNFAVNVPLDVGIDDESYSKLVTKVLERIREKFNPGAVVFQAGADSLAGDRIGCFNLSVIGHASPLQLVKSWGVPLLVLGGGGYTLRNVGKCWAYETATLLGPKFLDHLTLEALSSSRDADYFEGSMGWSIPTTNLINMNPPEKLETLTKRIMENLGDLKITEI